MARRRHQQPSAGPRSFADSATPAKGMVPRRGTSVLLLRYDTFGGFVGVWRGRQAARCTVSARRSHRAAVRIG